MNEFFPCDDKREKDARLRHWIEELKPTLNTNVQYLMTFQDYRKMWEKKGKRGKMKSDKTRNWAENRTQDWVEIQTVLYLNFNILV